MSDLQCRSSYFGRTTLVCRSIFCVFFFELVFLWLGSCLILILGLGLDQAGLAATISFSISLLPSDLQGMFWANIGLIGGTTKFSGFRERL